MSPCPDCGENRGGRYSHGHDLVCWPCFMARTGIGPLPANPPAVDPAWVVFRMALIGALWAVDPKRFVYVNEDRIGGRCPICATGHVTVDFHGTTPRADISCSLGCAEIDIAHGIAGRRAA
jgi:endogenous inhibitor of DNA gyrase (YacG/DUF329 family)